MEDVTDRSNTVLLWIVEQMYEFHGKLEKLLPIVVVQVYGFHGKLEKLLPIVVRVYRFHGKVKKEKALNHHKQENNKKGCVEKFTER